MIVMKQLYRRVYVRVTSYFDQTGFMTPISLTWIDGRTFEIEAVRDFRPAASLIKGHTGDCYTVIIRGGEKHLFFEKTSQLFAARVGRWFIEKPIEPEQVEKHTGVC